MSARLAAWAQARRDFEWQGHRLFVRDEGTGPAVVLLHGYPTGSYDWHAVWPWRRAAHGAALAGAFAPHGRGLAGTRRPLAPR